MLTQATAPWWTALLGVLIGGILGAMASWRAASAQRKFDLKRAEREKARAVDLDEIEQTRKNCSGLFNDLQSYARQALLLRADATIGRKSSVEVALAISESQASVIETYATARLHSPGPVSDATARIIKVVGDCPILESEEAFEAWSAECKRMSAFLLEVGEHRIKELSGKEVPKGWYADLVASYPTRNELRKAAEQIPKRSVPNSNARPRLKVKTS